MERFSVKLKCTKLTTRIVLSEHSDQIHHPYNNTESGQNRKRKYKHKHCMERRNHSVRMLCKSNEVHTHSHQ